MSQVFECWCQEGFVKLRQDQAQLADEITISRPPW